MQSIFNFGGTSDVLGLVSLAGAYSTNGTGFSHTYTATANFSVNLTQLATLQNLQVGLLNGTGTGFSSLEFTIHAAN